MAIGQMLLPEFEQEMKTTRKYLERVPADKAAFKPHEKSMSLERLAGHVAELAGWVTVTLTQDSLDFAPKDGPKWEALVSADSATLLAAFDRNVAEARQALVAAKDEDFGKEWSLLRGGQALLRMPKGAVLRSFALNHLVHHRAQLGVYLRMNGVPVPATYGPTADER